MFVPSCLKTFSAVAAAALLLAACAAEPDSSGETASPAAQTGTALPPPDPDQPSSPGVQPAPNERLPETASKTPAGGEPVVIEGPDGTTWAVQSPKDEEAYRADVEDCYRYAQGQTRRDAQYLNDRNAGIDTLSNESRYAPLQKRVDEYDLRNRRTSLMSSCMESKGYARADTVLPRLEF
ncbi:hypothetical protein AAFN88_10210 [Pelagibius sp. CAU 1746]|uniref:hypothetical protein n=1 Tax=Pelagibius sp. CAU 1746 TaxID=3140370 RepID=UPI00325B6E77